MLTTSKFYEEVINNGKTKGNYMINAHFIDRKPTSGYLAFTSKKN